MSRTPRPLTPAQVARLDKRTAAAHEAGHATVAAALGVRCRVAVRPSGVGGLEHRYWVGSTGFCQPLNGQVRAVIGVAGLAAECRMDDEDPSDPASILDYWECGAVTPSDTDLRFIPAGSDDRLAALHAACDILDRQHRLYRRVFARLLAHHALTDDDMDRLARVLLR